MEDFGNWTSEEEFETETEYSDVDSDKSDLYGDLELSLSEARPLEVSANEDVDDADIFLELGMPLNLHQEGEASHLATVVSQSTQQLISDDIKSQLGASEIISDKNDNQISTHSTANT
ncbi:hypothetical protein OTU49_007334, partial [Cherax quadricarinatus]